MSTRTERHDAIARAVAATLCLAAASVIACRAPDNARANDPDERSEASTAAQADQDALVAAHRAWVRSFEQGDAKTALSLLEHSDSLLIYHPFIDNRFDGYDEASRGMTRMLSRIPRLTWTEAHQAVRIEGDVGWVTSQIMIKAEEIQPPFIGRGTEIWVRHDGRWLLAHGHWSEHAELASRHAEE